MGDSYSAAVDIALKQVVAFAEEEYDSDLDAADFEATEYINQKFPTEGSLGGLDRFLADTNREIQHLDDAMSECVRAQSCIHRNVDEELRKAKDSITTLFGMIGEIKGKAEQSEEMVHSICKDISRLDVAKRHLNTSMTTLKRVDMLMNAVHRLQHISVSGEYDNAGYLLLAVDQLLTNFSEYSTVPRIADILTTIDSIKSSLHGRIFREFEQLTELGATRLLSDQSATITLRQACAVVDALGPDTRNELVDIFCRKHLKPYIDDFLADAMQDLDHVKSRYAWFYKAVKEFDFRFGDVFPKEWRVSLHLCEQFCDITRTDVEKILSTFGTPDSVPAMALTRALTKTLVFEKNIHTWLEAEESKVLEVSSLPAQERRREWLRSLSKEGVLSSSGGLVIASKGTSPAGPPSYDAKLEGIISGAFVRYMGSYVAWERLEMEKILNEASATDAHESCGSIPVFRSSLELFNQIRGSMTHCTQLSTGYTMYQVVVAIKETLRAYGNMLIKRVPVVQPTGEVIIASSGVAMLCQVVNTATYCAETQDRLMDSIRKAIDPAFADFIDFSEIKEFFQYEVAGVGLKALAGGIACLLDAPLKTLKKISWVAVTDVGDQSEYVAHMAAILQEHVPIPRKALSDENFITFCDKFAHAFIPRLIASVYATKRIGEHGAQQLLLDITAIRCVLLDVPSLIGEDDDDLSPAAAPLYAKFVSREVSRLVLLLKLVSTPKDRFSDSVRTLWPEASAPEIQLLMDLRGTNKREQTEALDQLGLKPDLPAHAAAISVKGIVGRFQSGPFAFLKK